MASLGALVINDRRPSTIVEYLLVGMVAVIANHVECSCGGMQKAMYPILEFPTRTCGMALRLPADYGQDKGAPRESALEGVPRPLRNDSPCGLRYCA